MIGVSYLSSLFFTNALYWKALCKKNHLGWFQLRFFPLFLFLDLRGGLSSSLNKIIAVPEVRDCLSEKNLPSKEINRAKLDEYETNVSHCCCYQYANVRALQYYCGNTAVLLWKQWCGLLKERWSTVKWLWKTEGSISLWAFLLKRTAENWKSNLIHIAADFEGWAQGIITKLQPQHSGRRSWTVQDHWRDKQKYYLHFNR